MENYYNELPEGYEDHIAPRSSTFKKWGIIQTNGIGIIDNSYSGDNDIWKMPVLATKDITINVNDRICQFRIMQKIYICYIIDKLCKKRNQRFRKGEKQNG